MNGMRTLQEDERFYFDAEKAERPIRFIETFCRHYEGKLVGEPLKLEEIQKQIIRDLFGWIDRETGQRRFTDCYWEAAVGTGKSPLLAALGLYGLMADGEPGAQVWSLAGTYGQARVVFETAKKYATAHPELARRLEIRQYEIRHPRSNSAWRICSGKGPGSGCRPSMILADEVHEWKGAGAYQALRDRMGKRNQPLLIAATNTPESQASFCWKLREKAVAALAGKGDLALYPIIWKAENDDADTFDPNAWRQANPLIGVTIAEHRIRQLAEEAADDEEDLANFRRLYLGIGPKTASGRWLDLSLWDRCVSTDKAPADAPVYIGADLSLGDDLCAIVDIGVTRERFYFDAEFWVPEATAKRYEAKDGIPYAAWAEAGHIKLLKEATISDVIREQIAARILERIKGRTFKAVCYDRYRADKTIAVLEAAGVTCVPVPQGYSLSPGCMELDRRIKERSAVLPNNHVFRWCAENCEVKQDGRGNIWPVKPNAKGNYAGTRGLKIDGITAAVTALTEARKHVFPSARNQWKGKVVVA